MDLIDEQGRVLGLVNVVDLLVVLVFVAFVVAGVAIVTDDGFSFGESTEAVTVVLETTERPYMTTALTEANSCDRGATVEHVLVADRFTPENESTQYHRLRVTARVEATETDGGWQFRGRDVYVGGSLGLDLCTVRVEGTVVEFRDGGTEAYSTTREDSSRSTAQ